MSEEIKISENKKVKSTINASCGKCKRKTKHKVLSGIALDGIYRDIYQGAMEIEVNWHDDYLIIQCRGCENITFMKMHWNSEDINHYNDDIETKIYPNPEEGREVLDDTIILPAKLQRIYTETIHSLNSNQPILTGIGIRAIVETICKDKNAKGNDLFKKINDLVLQGVLTKDGADILHKLRTLGNKSAHKAKPHDTIQLGLALDVIEHLIQGVYILPYHAGNKFT